MARMPKSVLSRTDLEPALAFLRELWALDHALGSLSKHMHDRFGVTSQQRMVLRFIGKFPNITAAELAAMLHVEKGTLSLALKRLEARKLLARRPDELDARKTRIVLTAEGQRFNRPFVGTVERAVERVLKETKPRDVDAIRTFLQRLVVVVEETDLGPPKPRTKSTSRSGK